MNKYNIDSQKLIYHPRRVTDWLEGKKTYPIYVEISLTNLCNHNCSFCIGGDSKVLMDDFTTKLIKNINIDDKVIGFDELTPKSGRYRKIYPVKVLNKFKRKSNTIEIILNDNKELIVTNEHKILSNRGHLDNSWREAEKFIINQEIRINPYQEESQPNIYDDEYINGYLTGIILGDGGLNKKYVKWSKDKKYKWKYRFRLAMKDMEPIYRVHEYFKLLGINHHFIKFDIHKKGIKELYKDAISTQDMNNYLKIESLVYSNLSENNSKMYKIGFLAGIYDAEGSIDKKSHTIRITNTNIEIIEEIERCLDDTHISYKREMQLRQSQQTIYTIRIINGKRIYNNLRFIQITSPAIKRKGISNFYNTRMFDSVKIKCIKKGKDIDVYNLETESNTYIANGFCVHNCAPNFTRTNKSSLDTTTVKDMLDNMVNIGVKAIMFGGEGEPLLHKDIAEIVKHAKELGLDVALTTNGALLNKQKALQLLPYLSWIKFSMDSGDMDTYSRLHGTKKEDFKTVLDNISMCKFLTKLKKWECTIGVQALLFKDNLNDLYKLARILKVIRADYLVLKPFSEHTKRIGDELKLPTIEEIDTLMMQLKQYETEDFRIIFRKNAIVNLNKKKQYNKCYAQDFMAYIDSYGGVHSCINYMDNPLYTYGNINKNTFEDIWKKKPFIKPNLGECRTVCRLDLINQYLYELKSDNVTHKNFI
jgi:MoaA/NifB/PqqE/SkfB family radical SAM enzyme